MTRVDDLELLYGFRDDGDENLADLDPLLVWRLAAAYAYSEVLRKYVTIESGVRTRAEQEYLFAGWKARTPGFNLAADPNRIIGRNGGTVWRGSYHMAQNGVGYAVDLTRPGRHVGWDAVHRELRAMGLHTTVPGEPWHHQATTIRGPLPGPFPPVPFDHEEDYMTPELQTRLDELQTELSTWVLNGHVAVMKKLEEIEMRLEGINK
jgi:hypothetical protein